MEPFNTYLGTIFVNQCPIHFGAKNQCSINSAHDEIGYYELRKKPDTPVIVNVLCKRNSCRALRLSVPKTIHTRSLDFRCYHKKSVFTCDKEIIQRPSHDKRSYVQTDSGKLDLTEDQR